MIIPRKPPKKHNRYLFSTFDLENDSETGELLSLDILYPEGDDLVLRHFYDIGEWLLFSEKVGEENKALREQWAHNGANYDWNYVIEYISEKRPDIRIEVLTSGSKGISLRLKFKKKKWSLNLLDSLRLMPDGLEKLAHDMQVETKKLKIDVLPSVLFHNDRKTYDEYLEADVRSLHEIITKFVDIINTEIIPDTPINKPSHTIASQAMAIFKIGFLHRTIFTPWNKRAREFERKCMHGGLVFCPKKGVFDHTTGADIISSYPYAMANQLLPVSCRIRWTRKFRPEKVGMYYIRFKLSDDRLKFIFNENRVQSSEGNAYVTSEDCLSILETGGTFEVIEGFYYLETEYLLKDYAEKLYHLKWIAKKTGRKALEKVAKLLLNSLYGKFGQKDIVLSYEQLDASKIVYYRKLGINTYHVRGNWFQVEQYKPADNTFPGIAALISSRARRYLVQSIWPNRDRLILADTDSMVLQGNISNIPVGSELGNWEIEFEDAQTTVIARKTYAVIKDEEVKKVRAKGLPLKSIDKTLFIGNMQKMAMSSLAHSEYSYFSPPTVLDVIKGKKAGLWMEKHKRIKPNDDETRFIEKILVEEYKRNIQLGRSYMAENPYQIFLNTVREMGGIAPYPTGYRQAEYKAIPVFLHRKHGLRIDEMTENLKTNYPWLGIETDNDLLDKIREYEIWRLNHPNP